MDALRQLDAHLPADLRRTVRQLKSPFDVQEYLISMPYRGEARDRSPLNVMLDRQCHCLDGGLLAALLLWRLGFRPLLVDLVPAPGLDDDHVLALYQVEGGWGAVAKSNYVNLGFRDPVYRNLRELAMSYLEHFCNTHQVKTLRGYSRPYDLSKFPRKDWGWNEDGATLLYRSFYERKTIPLFDEETAARLTKVTDRTYSAEILFSDLGEAFGNRQDH